MIDKWLSAGVLEEGTLRRSDTGTPQGGVVSPQGLRGSTDAKNARNASDTDIVLAFEDWVNG